MLKTIRKLFNTQKEAEMKDENVAPGLNTPTLEAQLAETQAALASSFAENAAVSTQLAELSTLYEGVKATLDAIEAEKATLVANAAAKRLQTRTEAVVASVGTDKATSLLAATDALSDEQFEAVVGALSTSFEKESKTSLFKEVGVSAPADAEKIIADAELTAEAKILQKKYSKKKK